jgi:hypothetical protein
MRSEIFLDNISKQVESTIIEVEKLKHLDNSKLTWRENDHAWNILECIEHLNLYGQFYLPQIALKIQESNSASETEFKPGILGNYFSKSMLPKTKLNKMKTFKDKNPINTILDIGVIDLFLNQQQQLLQIIYQAQKVSLNKVKIETSISSWIRLKLGDALQFYVNHILRHLEQIERIKRGH